MNSEELFQQNSFKFIVFLKKKSPLTTKKYKIREYTKFKTLPSSSDVYFMIKEIDN